MRLSSRTRIAVRPSLACAETTSKTRWKEEAGATGGGREGRLGEGGGE